MVDPGPPPPNNGHFMPKNGFKMPFLCRKRCFLGSGGQFKPPPHPISQVLHSEKHVLQSWGPKKLFFQGRPRQHKWPFVAEKWP